MQSFADSAPASNPFVTVFADKMKSIPDLPAAQQQKLLAEAKQYEAQANEVRKKQSAASSGAE